jgi:hypothetical protein
MAGRMWGAIKSWLVRFRWLLALGALALLVILACVFFIPLWLLQWELGGQTRTLAAADRATAINDIRTTLLQGIGGVLLVLGAFFTYRQLQTSRDQLAVAEQGQVTERFTRAIDQLSKERTIDQRIGGIYALDRIMRDSPKDHSAVVEVLAAFVRERAAMPPSAVTDSPDAAPEDVEAALTVLGHRPQRPDMEVTPIRLSSKDRPTNLPRRK